MMRIRVLTLLSLFFFSAINEASGNIINNIHSTGLTFKSFDVNKDERTSLDLLPEESIDLKGGFTLEFDLRLNNIWDSFGYIFRIVTNDSTSLDMTSFIRYRNIKIMLNNVERTKIVSEYRINENFLRKEWVKVIFRADEKGIKCLINGEPVSINNPIKDLTIDKIFFGINRYKSFYTSDIPPMSVKNLIIRNRKKEIVRYWELGRHAKGIVYDQVDNAPARVENGIWEIDHHIKWKRELAILVHQENPQVATDSISRRIFVATSDSLFILHISSKKIDKIKVKSGSPFIGASSYLIYDYRKDRLISYNMKQSRLISYSFKKNSWSGYPTNTDLWFQHNNRLIDPETNKLVVFGGYGLYRYKANLSSHPLDGGDWKTVDLNSQIHPRYLASLGYLGNGKVLVMGGFGNESGVQEVGARNFYDIYQIDIRNSKCLQLGRINNPPSHYVYGNSMTIDQKKKLFYTLGYRNDIYKSSITLFEINLKTLDYRILGDSIPFKFQDTESFCDLFRCKTELYAVVSQKDKGGFQRIEVLSLAYPPLQAADVLQTNLSPQNGREYIWIIIGVALVMTLTILYRKSNKNKIKAQSKVNFKEETNLPKKIVKEIRTTSSILLLGGFRILNKKGNDISEHFTPIIKQLLLRCMLENFETGIGVTSKKLEETIWFDMDKASATNNRNVNIRKLRLLLQDVGNVTLTKDHFYWIINMSDCFCDYFEVMNLLNEVKQTSIVDKQKIERIVDIASAGTLLSNIDLEWADKYKSNYSSLLISVLLNSSKDTDIKKDLNLLVHLSDAILIHDSLDEDSIRIKCLSLYQLGQRHLSKQCYDKFCNEYLVLLNEEPKLKYNTIISETEE